MTYTLPELSFNYGDFEPHLDAKTMEIHHTKHHATYVNKLNEAIQSANFEAPKCPCKLVGMLDEVPESIRQAVRNHGGGHINHNLFWKILGKPNAPEGDLLEALKMSFGSLEGFKEQFSKAALTHFGSGWAWCYMDASGKLMVGASSNQDNPRMGLSYAGLSGKPIVGLDVWEHAYYLNYQNRRPDYIEAFWKVLDWSKVAKIFAHVRKCKCKSS